MNFGVDQATLTQASAFVVALYGVLWLAVAIVDWLKGALGGR